MQSVGCEMRAGKFNARRTEVDGIRFDSAAEARRYTILAQKQEAGVIFDLRLQPKFPCTVQGRHICEYRADFSYVRSGDGQRVVEDVKGKRTREYELKRKLVEALHGVEITEIPA